VASLLPKWQLWAVASEWGGQWFETQKIYDWRATPIPDAPPYPTAGAFPKAKKKKKTPAMYGDGGKK
jgi:hypothetical protein